jgi:hypothetical protein
MTAVVATTAGATIGTRTNTGRVTPIGTAIAPPPRISRGISDTVTHQNDHEADRTIVTTPTRQDGSTETTANAKEKSPLPLSHPERRKHD